jgi:predicted nucleic acid-binding protein
VNLVIDTSAIIAVLANEPEKPRLVELTTGVSLLAPQSVHWEIGNAFSAMLKRARVTLDQVRAAVAIYHRIPIRLLDVDLTEALAIAAEFDLYAYDAYLIACARKQRCSLLALDRGLVHAAKQAGVPVLEVSA